MAPTVLSIDYVNVLRGLGYEFQLNELTDRIEVNGDPITDTLEAVLCSRLRDKGYSNMKAARDAWTAYGYNRRYHPVRDYLNGLRYDGGHYIEDLANYFVDPDDLFIKELRIDEGVTLRRFRAASMGRAVRIRKRTSHITIKVAEQEV